MTETLVNVSTQPQNISQPHIEIENLNLWYGEKQVLKISPCRLPKTV